jgi:hypothetical protein
VPEVAGSLAKQDDAEEDQSDHQHHEDHVAALLGGRLLGGEEEREHAHRRRSLIDPLGVERKSVVSDFIRRVLVREGADRRGPGLTVFHPSSLGAQMGTQGKELGQPLDRSDVPDGGDTNETVGVEVVPEQDGRVPVVR